jgi:cell wall-associated NlpC family hydrolase
MWFAAKAVASWIFGDTIIKYTLYCAVGLVAFTIMEASSFNTVMSSMPWGTWWFARGSVAAQPQAQVRPVHAAPAGAILPAPTLVPLPMAASPTRAADFIAALSRWIGTRYLWGGCSRAGIDCSCLVQNALRTIGIDAPRTTGTQVRWARPVSRVELQPGDLIFFDNTCTGCGPNPTHVGVFIGGGQMIHAGDPVQISSVMWSNYASAGRVPGL